MFLMILRTSLARLCQKSHQIVPGDIHTFVGRRKEARRSFRLLLWVVAVFSWRRGDGQDSTFSGLSTNMAAASSCCHSQSHIRWSWPHCSLPKPVTWPSWPLDVRRPSHQQTAFKTPRSLAVPGFLVQPMHGRRRQQRFWFNCRGTVLIIWKPLHNS